MGSLQLAGWVIAGVFATAGVAKLGGRITARRATGDLRVPPRASNIGARRARVLIVMTMAAALTLTGVTPVHAQLQLTVDSTLDEPDAVLNDNQCTSIPSGKCTLGAALQASLHAADRTVAPPKGS